MDAWTEIEKAEEQFLSNLAENGGLHPDLAGMLRHCSRFIAGLKRRAAASPQAAPAGMVLVPREPTEAMVSAPNTIIQSYGARLIWQRMLAAAPAAQVASPLSHPLAPEGGTYSAAPAKAGHVRMWTDDECLAFASVAFRHASKNLPDGVTLQDIRLGATRVTSAPAVVVDEAMVIRACNAYDASREDGNAAEYVGMHAALAAAMEGK